jgi:hypothetical protein
MVTGRAFHNFGATDEKLLSPYLTVLETKWSKVVELLLGV